MFLKELPHSVHCLLLVFSSEAVALALEHDQRVRSSGRLHFIVQHRRLFNRHQRISITM